jgi:transcriptional regulator with XRE-family HTH domain
VLLASTASFTAMEAQAQPVPDAAALFTQHSMPAFADIRASRVETAGAKDLPLGGGAALHLILDMATSMIRMRNTMPAPAPFPAEATAALLGAIGQRIRTQRQALGVSTIAAAEAAGMSRVTLHRIERGEASVTMGAYLNALTALGLGLDVVAPAAPAATTAAPQQQAALPPERIRLADFPQLRQLAWHIPGAIDLSPQEALSLYERNWRHIDLDRMDPHERQLLDELRSALGRGHLLV